MTCSRKSLLKSQTPEKDKILFTSLAGKLPTLSAVYPRWLPDKHATSLDPREHKSMGLFIPGMGIENTKKY